MKLYRPTSLVVVLCVLFVETSISLTAAPAMVALCGSITWPEIEPVADCDQADVAPRLSNSNTAEKYTLTLLSLRLRFICPYPFVDTLDTLPPPTEARNCDIWE